MGIFYTREFAIWKASVPSLRASTPLRIIVLQTIVLQTVDAPDRPA